VYAWYAIRLENIAVAAIASIFEGASRDESKASFIVIQTAKYLAIYIHF
jgi:hypothetical protein